MSSSAPESPAPAAVRLPPPAVEDDESGLAGVKNIVAVSSCKGGVGKSTTSVNLAYTLKEMGFKVGVLDADVFGPSLPTMVTPSNDAVNFYGRRIRPLSHAGVQLMSFGYVNEGSATMRGPMLDKLMRQFVDLTHWGELDYLIVDMPPGTGDIQLTLSQTMDFTGAVIVTTPSKLSYVDVHKGIEMFETVDIPCLAVVENMAYLDQGEARGGSGQLAGSDWKELENDVLEEFRRERKGDLDESQASALLSLVRSAVARRQKKESKLRLFGRGGHSKVLLDDWGIQNMFEIPISTDIAQTSDDGVPYVEKMNFSDETCSAYKSMASSLVAECKKIRDGKKSIVTIKNSDDMNVKIVYREYQGVEGDADDRNVYKETVIGVATAKQLREACRCASCVDELSGLKNPSVPPIPPTIYPSKMGQIGNYGLSVQWSDGHDSLYSYKFLRDFAKDPDNYS